MKYNKGFLIEIKDLGIESKLNGKTKTAELIQKIIFAGGRNCIILRSISSDVAIKKILEKGTIVIMDEMPIRELK